MKIDNSDYFSKLAVFSNYSLKKIENEFPDYLDVAMENWLYNFHLYHHDFNEHEEDFANQKAAHAANLITDDFYNSLSNGLRLYELPENDFKKTSDENLEDYSDQEWDGILSDSEYSTKFYNKTKNNHKNNATTKKENKKYTIKKKQNIFKKIHRKFPENLDEALEIWNYHYKQNKSKSLPEGYSDNYADGVATEKLENYYNALEIFEKYETNLNNENKDINQYVDLFFDKIDPVIDNIIENHPESIDDAVNYWFQNLSRIYSNRENDKELAIKIANRRLRYFNKKLEN